MLCIHRKMYMFVYARMQVVTFFFSPLSFIICAQMFLKVCNAMTKMYCKRKQGEKKSHSQEKINLIARINISLICHLKGALSKALHLSSGRNLKASFQPSSLQPVQPLSPALRPKQAKALQPSRDLPARGAPKGRGLSRRSLLQREVLPRGLPSPLGSSHRVGSSSRNPLVSRLVVEPPLSSRDPALKVRGAQEDAPQCCKSLRLHRSQVRTTHRQAALHK